MSRIFLSFAMYSVSISASDMASILGCEPDLAVIKGSERTPPRSRPTVHSWSIQEIDEIHDDLQGSLRLSWRECKISLQGLTISERRIQI